MHLRLPFRVFFLLELLLLSSVAFSQQNTPNFTNVHALDQYNPEYKEGVVLVKFKDSVKVEMSESGTQLKSGSSGVQDIFNRYGVKKAQKVFPKEKKRQQKTFLKTSEGKKKEVPQLFNIYKLKMQAGDNPKEISKQMNKEQEVEYAEPDYKIYSMETHPDDPLYQNGSQDYLKAINAPAAWDSTSADSTEVIGILDTGVDWDHPDLDGNIWSNPDEIPGNGKDDDGNGYVDDVRGWDFINNDNDPDDDNSHGTHVAGIAAAEGNNGTGITGVAYNASIMPIKVLQSSGTGNSSDLAQAINYASNKGASVINMSLGSYGESMTVKTALENAYTGTGDEEGSMLVAAAGNDGQCICNDCGLCATMFPAGYPFVLGVQANAEFSNNDPTGPIKYTHPDGFNYEMTAPGVNIMSTKTNGGYWGKSGTSMASPMVAGAVALMRNNDSTLTGEQIFSRLIQGSTNGILDIKNSLDLKLKPDIRYIDFTIVDTLSGCDNDGHADAGETIELYLSVKNAGGQADSVWSKIRFAQFEDTSTAQILDSTSIIGSMSAYSQLTGERSPLKLKIDSSVAHNRDIVFETEIFQDSVEQTSHELSLTVQHGEEIGGFYTKNLTLESGKEYYGTESVVIDNGDTLFIEPGVVITMDNGKSINVKGSIFAEGKKDSMILFTASQNGWENILLNTGKINYAIIEKLNGNQVFTAKNNNLVVSNTIIRNNNPYNFFEHSTNCYFKNCNITSNVLGSQLIWDFESLKLEHTNVIQNAPNEISPLMCDDGTSSFFLGNNIYSNYNYIMKGDPFDTDHVATFNSQTYYGAISKENIDELIWDYFDDSEYGIVNIENFSKTPDSLAHGIAWKVDVNNTSINKYDNPYDAQNGLGIIGSETLKFDVHFNRPMDTSVTPLLTFGVREPYTQHVVSDSTSWSEDSTTWTAHYTTGLETGDGIQRVRVAEARDDEKFKIPEEDKRFEFVLQAAGAQSIEFLATPGIGKVNLEWPPAPTEDALGYNLYRCYNTTDSTVSDTVKVNRSLITDTTFTDFNVIPDTTYHYAYTTLGTDMKESDNSKSITVTPLSAADGDANGDQSVDVLDITSIVSYLLEEDPEPFLFDAADVNYNDQINVLDIIGVADLVSGSKKAAVSGDTNPEKAYMMASDDSIILENAGNIAALQFTLEGENLEDQKLLLKTPGFEFAYRYYEETGRTIGVIYSLSGNEIPEGEELIIRIKGDSPVSIASATGGDLEGREVPVIIGGTTDVQPVAAKEKAIGIKAIPNPFKEQTRIHYTMPQAGRVTIEFYNTRGQTINRRNLGKKPEGEHSITWSAKKQSGAVVFCRVRAMSPDGKVLYSETEKLVEY
jgi:subtilisin family serine protease